MVERSYKKDFKYDFSDGIYLTLQFLLCDPKYFNRTEKTQKLKDAIEAKIPILNRDWILSILNDQVQITDLVAMEKCLMKMIELPEVIKPASISAPNCNLKPNFQYSYQQILVGTISHYSAPLL
jgi:hypothetical protein